MGSNLSIAKVWGVPIRLHLSWFLIFALITWSLASGYFPNAYPALDATTYWILGAFTSLAFALSVLLHELGHVALALRNGIGVKGVTLFIFGGLAELESDPHSAGAEFRVAIAGPLVSLALAVVFGLLWMFDRTFPLLAAPSEYLFRINLALALFNLIPGFPLDGGRVLRAAVWQITGDGNKATKFASGAGQLVALGFIGVGVFIILQGNLFNGLWLAFIGWFLQNAASAAASHAKLQEALSGTRVDQVMRRDFQEVPSMLALDELVNYRVLNGGQQVFVVWENGQPEGIVTLNDIAAVPQRKWPYTTLRQVMQPLDRLTRVTPDMELFTALQEMDQAAMAHIPVTGREGVVGMLTREDVARYLHNRTKLGL